MGGLLLALSENKEPLEAFFMMVLEHPLGDSDFGLSKSPPQLLDDLSFFLHGLSGLARSSKLLTLDKDAND
ncbi:hypothetical protein COCNU_contig68696414G000010 [Cocos nucifera]|nr:hypothetical protein [Cocos nucifera]